MSDQDRPKPQYGEYASDQEQARALERSGVAHERAEVQAARVSHEPLPPAVSVQSPRRSLDRIVTVFLLAFGAVSVIGGASNFVNLSETLSETMQRFGAGEYQATAQTAGIGIALLVSQILFWLAAAVISYRRIVRHKLTWWVPVLAGVLSFVVLTVLLGSLLMSDPAFIASIPNV